MLQGAPVTRGSALPLLLHILLVSPLAAYDKGFDLLYTSNTMEVQDLEVTFNKPLPQWMKGTLFHNGLGQFEMGSRNVTHFLDAFAKVHSWQLQGGSNKALFTTSFVRTGYYTDSVSINDIAPYMLFTNPKPHFKLRGKLMQFVNGLDNANINLFKMGDDLVAVADVPRMYVLEEAGLKTMARVDPKIPDVPSIGLRNMHLSTSHPVPEHGTNNWINIVTMGLPFVGSSLHVVRCTGATRRELITTIKLRYTPYMHSFATTEKYIILFMNPVSIAFLRSLYTGEAIQSIRWTKQKLTYVHVVEITTGKVQVLETEPFFGFHFANAFVTSNNMIKVDVTTYPNLTVLKKQKLNLLLDPVRRDTIPVENAKLKRYVIDLKAGTVEPQILPVNPSAPAASRLEFPVFNELYRFKKYCFIYGTTQKMDAVHTAKWAVSKKDTCDPAGDKVWYKENHYPGNPWFVPRPGAEQEDDGHLMVVMLDGERRRSYLAVFDAQTLEMVNQAYLPTHLPMTLHGRYLETSRHVDSGVHI